MKKIGIFCSAADTIQPIYFEKAEELGVWLGQNQKTLVYGGANIGLMECVAQAARKHGALIMGVVPTKLEDRGAVSDLLDVTFRTDNLSDRKDTILRESDILIALPGGVGTLDEVFHVMASASIGYHAKKVIFYNVDGFWNDLLCFLQKLREQHFARRPWENFYLVANSFEELVEQLK
ncbi:MAG: TIGR00730 family Rossman fold protein [Bacteroides sp.]|nr:TIGR00730 family Rossman fold protein [Bacteroides sp.]